jgi:hypothetical protein
MDDTSGFGVGTGRPAERPTYFGFKSHEDVPFLVHLREESSRELVVPKIGHEVAAWIRQEAGALVVQDAEKTGEKEVIAAINTRIAKG